MRRNTLLIFVLMAAPFWTCSKSPTSALGPKPPASESPAPAQPEAAAKPSEPAKPVAINARAQAIILGYHRLVDKVRHPDTEITPSDFEAQMQQLKDQGIHVISLQDILAWKRGEKDIPPMSAVVTFDDGWKSQYEVAWPILKKFGYPFTMFIYTDYIKGGPKSGGESITWDQLSEMRDAGVDIQGHTVSHRDLTAKAKRAQAPDYDTWLWNELFASKQLLEQHLGVKINTLAAPYGRSNEHVRQVATKAGYEALLTVYGQKITRGTPPLAMGRYMMEANKPQVFVAAVRFDGGSAGAPPAVAELSSRSFAAQPADGATITDPQPLIKASVESFGAVNPSTLVMRISGFGKVDAKYDPKSKTLSYQPTRKLRESTYSVFISGESGGRKQEARWSFTVAPKAGTPPPAASATP